jgi:hypothetical protein
MDGIPKTEIIRMGFGGRWPEAGGEVTQQILLTGSGILTWFNWELN